MILVINGCIDSTFASILCSKFDKKTNTKLIWVFLMCSTNKQDESSVSDLVCKAFCNEYYKEKKSLWKFLFVFCKNSSAINGMSTKASKGNIKESLRMIYLWNLCGFRNGVTIDTDNRTKHELGFFTLMGDQNYFNPWFYISLEDRQKYMNFNRNIPTDGNGVSNSDCIQFELDNYEQVDDILKIIYYIEKLPEKSNIS